MTLEQLEAKLNGILASYSEEKVLSSLQKLDADNDGKIPVDEFKYYLDNFGQKMSEKDIQNLVDLSQPDSKGLIDIKKYSSKLSI